jgi:hypothetical protein
MDCIEKFQSMRDCFQEHPDVYRDELMEDEELDAELEKEKQELVGQIAERRKAEEAAASDGHRLLEEPVPASKSSVASKSSKPAQSSQSAPINESTKSELSPQKTSTSRPSIESTTATKNQPQREAKTVTTSESSTKASDENVIEGHRSKVQRKPSSPPVSQEALPESDELVPKSAFDARDSVGPGGVPPKEE